MRYAYPCNLVSHEDEGEGFVVTFPDVPAAITGAQTKEESLFLAEDALVAALSVYVQKQWDTPVPSQAVDGQELVAIPPVPAAKLALYTAMRQQGITKSALADRLNIDESAVRKLLDPDRYSHISTIMKALRAVGRSLVIEDCAA